MQAFIQECNALYKSIIPRDIFESIPEDKKFSCRTEILRALEPLCERLYLTFKLYLEVRGEGREPQEIIDDQFNDGGKILHDIWNELGKCEMRKAISVNESERITIAIWEHAEQVFVCTVTANLTVRFTAFPILPSGQNLSRKQTV